MALINWRRLFSNSGNIEKSNLEKVYARQSVFGGGVLSTSNQYELIWLSQLKNFYLSKFKYSGDTDKIDIKLLENVLWTWGKATIIKVGENFVIGIGKPIQWDYNNKPIKLTFTPIRMALKKEEKEQIPLSGKKGPLEYEVNKDCVYIQCSNEYYLGTTPYYSPFFRVQDILKYLRVIRDAQINNTIMGRSFITVPKNMDNEEVEKLNETLFSNDAVLKIGEQDMASTNIVGKTELFTFIDRQKSLDIEYQRVWEEAKTAIGVDTNANPVKMERTTNAEIEVNNSISDGINKTELLYRKEGIKNLKEVFQINLEIEIDNQTLDNGNEQVNQTINKGDNDD